MALVVAEGVAELITKGKTNLPFWWYDPYRFERGELRTDLLPALKGEGSA